MAGYFGGRRSVEKRGGRWKCAVERKAIKFFELRKCKGATKMRDFWRNWIRETMTRQEEKEEEEDGPFAFTATVFIKFLLFNYISKNEAVFSSLSVSNVF